MRLVNLQLNIYLQNMCQALCQAKRLAGLVLMSLVLVHTVAEAACTAGRAFVNIIETTPTNAFSHNGDSTVTHDLTGLIWDRCAVGMTFDDNSTPADFTDDTCTGTGSIYTWQDALKQVVSQNNSSHLGHSDWRLPNESELYSIVELCGVDPAINQLVFPDTPAGSNVRFWSATTLIGSLTEHALVVHYFVGSTAIMNKTLLANTVRLVRSGQPGDDFDLLDATLDQTITDFAATPPSGAVGGSSALSATASSGLAVTFDSNTPTICTVADSTVSYLAMGTCTVTADQAGDATYNPAPQVTLGIGVGLTDQVITNFGATPSTGVVNGSSTLSASGGASGNPVTFDSSTPAICTVAGNTVNYVAAGTCTVTADQAGNTSFNAAPQVTLDITVAKADQTITGLAANPATGVAGGTSALSATASSGLTVTFGSSTSAVCTVAGSTVTYVTAGTCTVTADQAGDADYNAASQVSLSITVAKADQTITGLAANPATGVVEGSSALSATASSGLTVSFGSSTPTVCTVAGTTVSYLAAGTCTVTADQAGDAAYNAATQVTLDVSVAKADQTISGLAADPASGVIGGTSTLSVSSGASVARIAQIGQKPPTTKVSGIPVTYDSSTLTICTVAGSTVSYLAVGTCTVTADQAGDADYNPAPQLTLDINVTESPPAILSVPIPNVPIPTLSLWGLVAMFLMILGVGGMVVRRKTRS